jgi:beta-phosphoglucomutase
MPIGFIFDLDGVLTDTNALQFMAWRKIATLESVPFKPDYENLFRGLPRHKCLDLLLDGKPATDAHRAHLMHLKDTYYIEAVNLLTPSDLLDGVGDFLAQAQAQGIPLGLASSSRRAREVCVRLGILDCFMAVGDGSTVVNHKPAPDIFLWVAGRLGISPQTCVVFEDASVGVRGARAGGFWVVGLGEPHNVGEAHRIYPSLAHITPNDCLPPFI